MIFTKGRIYPKAQAKGIDYMQTYEAIGKRVSTREYSDKPIPKDMLEKLVDAARRAPSARAVEPWEFIITEDKSKLKVIAGLAPNAPFISNAACAIIIACSDTKYYLEDGCAATENILLMAADLGLGACWIAGDKKSYCEQILSMFGIPQNMKLVSIISLGWPKAKSAQHKKRSLKEVIHWGKF
jgi:nitroreductase